MFRNSATGSVASSRRPSAAPLSQLLLAVLQGSSSPWEGCRVPCPRLAIQGGMPDTLCFLSRSWGLHQLHQLMQPSAASAAPRGYKSLALALLPDTAGSAQLEILLPAHQSNPTIAFWEELQLYFYSSPTIEQTQTPGSAGPPFKRLRKGRRMGACCSKSQEPAAAAKPEEVGWRVWKARFPPIQTFHPS